MSNQRQREREKERERERERERICDSDELHFCTQSSIRRKPERLCSSAEQLYTNMMKLLTCIHSLIIMVQPAFPYDKSLSFKFKSK